jgi:prefoldin subunit 5
MDNKSKLFFAFGAGVLLGAGLVALFTTDKGKAILETAKNQADDLAENLKAKIKDLDAELGEFLQDNEGSQNAQV